MPNSNLRPLQRYELALKSGEFSEDAQQRAAMTYLDNVYEQIMDNRAKGYICGAAWVVVRLG